MVHVARFKSVAVLKQRYLFNIAPVALGAVGEDGLYLIQERTLGQQILHQIEPLGNACDQTISVIALFVGAQGNSSGIACIDLNPGQVGRIAGIRRCDGNTVTRAGFYQP